MNKLTEDLQRLVLSSLDEQDLAHAAAASKDFLKATQALDYMGLKEYQDAGGKRAADIKALLLILKERKDTESRVMLRFLRAVGAAFRKGTLMQKLNSWRWQYGYKVSFHRYLKIFEQGLKYTGKDRRKALDLASIIYYGRFEKEQDPVFALEKVVEFLAAEAAKGAKV